MRLCVVVLSDSVGVWVNNSACNSPADNARLVMWCYALCCWYFVYGCIYIWVGGAIRVRFLGEMTNIEGRRESQKAVAGVAVKLGELQGNDSINKKRPGYLGRLIPCGSFY